MDRANAWFEAVLANNIKAVAEMAKEWAKSRTSDGETALMMAVRANQPDLIQVLIPYEGSILTPNGDTALAIAIQTGAPELCKLLVRAEGEIALPNGATPLRLAMDLGKIQCVEVLAPYYDASRDEHGLTHLDYAVLDRSPSVVRILCETGHYTADIVREALDFAQKDNSPEVVRVLEEWLDGTQDSCPATGLDTDFATEISTDITNSAFETPPFAGASAFNSTVVWTPQAVRPTRPRPKSASLTSDIPHHAYHIVSPPLALAHTLAQTRVATYNYKAKLRKTEEELSHFKKNYSKSEERNAFLEAFCIRQQEYIAALSRELETFRNAVYKITTERVEYIQRHPSHTKVDRDYVLGPKTPPLRGSSTYKLQQQQRPQQRQLKQGASETGFSSTIIRELLSTSTNGMCTRELLDHHYVGLKTLREHIQRSIKYDHDMTDRFLADIDRYIGMYSVPRTDLKAAFLNASGDGSKFKMDYSKERKIRMSTLERITRTAKADTAANVNAETKTKGTINYAGNKPRDTISYEERHKMIDSGPFKIPNSPSASLLASPLLRDRERSERRSHSHDPLSQSGAQSKSPLSIRHDPVVTNDDFNTHTPIVKSRSLSIQVLGTPECSSSMLSGASISPSVDVENVLTSSKVAQLDDVSYYIVDHVPIPGQYTLHVEEIDIRTELMVAVDNNDLQSCLKYFREQAGRQSENGVTALMIAAERGYVDCVRVLRRSEAGLRLSKLSYSIAPSTALMFAALNGHLSCAQLLLETEDDAKDERGWTALMCAVCSGNIAMVSLLLPIQAGMTTNDNFIFGSGFSALSIAILLDCIDTVAVLIQNEKERTALGRCEYLALDMARSKPMKSYLQCFI